MAALEGGVTGQRNGYLSKKHSERVHFGFSVMGGAAEPKAPLAPAL
jgi:hypothetical protein